mmetsp:Transcript_6637/g.9850  ORF Transcript_6637/g.9850 Transcript_6637/m.9850 type:complete len:1386 (+) Transcript_6637:93-4250(+)
MTCDLHRIGETDFWAANLNLSSEINKNNTPLALHFVIDNSGSMGGMAMEVRNIFSELVDSVASAPCSLTLFSQHASLLSDQIKSSKEMIGLPMVPQGMTNIPAGVTKAMDVITATEMSEVLTNSSEKTHHILILLTDGLHNTGPAPNKEFPIIGKQARENIPNVQLSVIVVGITRDSSTSMGMLLKTNIETVPLDSSSISNIYFAASRSSMRSVMAKLVSGLVVLSTGVVHTIYSPDGGILAEIGGEESNFLSVRTNVSNPSLNFLIKGKEPPHKLEVDGNNIKVNESDDIKHDLIADILATQIDRIRVKRIASSAGSASCVQPAIQHLKTLVDALDKDYRVNGRANLMLAGASAAERLAQYRKIITTVHVARELRNQLTDVANFANSCSEAQAAFLTGSGSKYASKALRRAAARSGDNDGILDPQKEFARVRNEVGHPMFAKKMENLLRIDTINHLKRLSTKQIQALKEHVKARSIGDFHMLCEMLDLLGSLLCDDNDDSLTAKVHTSALCWIPPTGDVFENIQTIRTRHDKHIKRWPPHVNLLYPFVPSNEFQDAAEKIAEAVRSIKPFDVNLTEIRNFSHSKRSYTAWLNPQEANNFISLQAACQAEFPQCNDLGKSGVFVPHLTVGQCTSKGSVEDLKASASWEPSLSRCGDICLISRKGQDEPFEIHWRVELGTGKCEVSPAASSEAKAAAEHQTESAGRRNGHKFESMKSYLQKFVDSGVLAGYLNNVFFGERRSYLSLLNPWEHIVEWKELGYDEKIDQGFKSQWEMLLYAGSIAYPIIVERSAGTQMNPFQIKVKKVHTSAIDTASLCCANQSEIDTFGPEGGEPIKDALVLVDPTCPMSSAKIVSSALLGETFTSVVLSRDLHMYTGAAMKAALHAHSLFSCLQPESCDEKSKSDVAAEIRREFLGWAYQCGSCGFGPVLHGGCSSLIAHHGEHRTGGVVSNACPSCGWFSPSLDSWKEWDGTIPETFLVEKMSKIRNGRSESGCKNKDGPKLLQSKADMILRIIYSFRKIFAGGGNNNPIRSWYNELASRLVEWDLRFSTQDEVDGLVQVLIAVAACDDDVLENNEDIEAAFAPPVVLAIVNEACARAARKKFRMAAKGDNGKAKDLAAKRVTKMLGVTQESAPFTTESLLESEPSLEFVKERCSGEYDIDPEVIGCEIEWAKKLASRWCVALEYIKALRKSLVKRGGGWERLEQDMETSLEDYDDVVHDLTVTPARTYLEACDIDEAHVDRTFVTIAAQAFLNNKGADRGVNLPDVRDGKTLRDIARDMRMRIYMERVGEKMTQWKNEGERMVFLKARVADIGQYAEMVSARQHVHGLTKEDFWGLWEAAVGDGHNSEKVRTFLETACNEFRLKYAAEGEVPCSKKGKKKGSRG